MGKKQTKRRRGGNIECAVGRRKGKVRGGGQGGDETNGKRRCGEEEM